MNKTYFIFSIILIGCISCNGLGPVDINIQTKNVDVTTEDIVGIWKMDKFSYEYLSGFNKDSIIISFKADHRFEMNNSHKLFDREINNTRIFGKWNIIDQYDTKSVELNFDGINISRKLDIYKGKDDYQLWNFLSDPDSGERIRFVK